MKCLKPDLAVGQIWRMRDGQIAILERANDLIYNFQDSTLEITWTGDGEYLYRNPEKSMYDLVEYLGILTQVVAEPTSESVASGGQGTPDNAALIVYYTQALTTISAAIVGTISNEEGYRRLEALATNRGMKVSEWITREAMSQAKANYGVLQEALRQEKEMTEGINKHD